MSLPTPIQMKQLGIKIQLTKKGERNLAKILEQGCPIKIVDNEIRPIRCRKDNIEWDCYKCWHYWLHTHAEIIKEDEQNGSAIS